MFLHLLDKRSDAAKDLSVSDNSKLSERSEEKHLSSAAVGLGRVLAARESECTILREVRMEAGLGTLTELLRLLENSLISKEENDISTSSGSIDMLRRCVSNVSALICISKFNFISLQRMRLMLATNKTDVLQQEKYARSPRTRKKQVNTCLIIARIIRF